MEEPKTFINKKGMRLYGIVHTPSLDSTIEKKIGITLLNPGIKYRVAPNRLNVKLARSLCELGYYVLRFDPEGIGDSEGELPQGVLVADVWEQIQKGLFINDVIIANDFFIKNYNIDKLFLAGNCGGAITALLTAAEDPRIYGLVLIDVPVNLRIATQNFANKVTPEGKKADWLFSEYIKNIFRLNSWYNFITFKTNYRALGTILNMKLKKLLTIPGNKNNIKAIEMLCHDGKLNQLFFQSFDTCISAEKPVLFILAGNDPGTEIFQHYFQYRYIKEKYLNDACANLIDYFLIDNANHVYSLSEWQEPLMNKICHWINKHAQT